MTLAEAPDVKRNLLDNPSLEPVQEPHKEFYSEKDLKTREWRSSTRICPVGTRRTSKGTYRSTSGMPAKPTAASIRWPSARTCTSTWAI